MVNFHSSPDDAIRDRKANGGQGMKWIRNEKRLAIYLRDGMACCWCGDSVEDGAKLTLDHCKPHSKGGSNGAENLVTACMRCNSSRGTRSLAAFAKAVAAYLNHGVTAESILRHVTRTRKRTLRKDEAKALIARRGGFVNAVREGR